jgi:AbrB family looped-hinge helix DNA binding protein
MIQPVLAELPNFCNRAKIGHAMDDLAQLSQRGTITLPAAVRRKLGLEEGDVLTVRLVGSSIVLTPAVVTPVELYTDERLAEFEQNAQLSEAELAAARRAWSARPRRR